MHYGFFLSKYFQLYICTNMLIYSPIANERLRYVLDYVLVQQLGLRYSITNDWVLYNNTTTPKLAYVSTQDVDELSIHIQSTSIILNNGIVPIVIETVLYKGVPCPFATNKGSMPFDVFAAIFYLITRYEEYLPYTPNQYGQYPATASYAHNQGILQVPVVDVWVNILKELLLSKYPSLPISTLKYTPLLTYDIDVAYAYKGRTTWQHVLLWLRDAVSRRLLQVQQRVGVLVHNDPDPYDTYAHIIAQANKYKHKPILFLLVGNRNKYNRNIPYHSKAMQALVQQVKLVVTLGIHPSYNTMDNEVMLYTEIQRILALGIHDVKHSRQHYLRLALPTTYNQLVAAGISHDYSMGYAEQPGFRASTSKPFFFFDVQANKATPLTIHPITYMEGTLAEDMHLTATQAQAIMEQLLLQVQQVGGQVCTVWHNHTLSNQGIWAGYLAVHDAMVHKMYNTHE